MVILVAPLILVVGVLVSSMLLFYGLDRPKFKYLNLTF